MKLTSVTAALAASTCIIALTAPVQAQQGSYNIPAGSLKGALDAYGRQTERPVIYKSDQVRGIESSGYRGNASAKAAPGSIRGELRSHCNDLRPARQGWLDDYLEQSMIHLRTMTPGQAIQAFAQKPVTTSGVEAVYPDDRSHLPPIVAVGHHCYSLTNFPSASMTFTSPMLSSR